jgi:hypothetical protein
MPLTYANMPYAILSNGLHVGLDPKCSKPSRLLVNVLMSPLHAYKLLFQLEAAKLEIEKRLQEGALPAINQSPFLQKDGLKSFFRCLDSNTLTIGARDRT